jgi:hypothetical protein
MTKKPKRVPGTFDAKPNREQRRHPEGSPQDHPLVRDIDAPEMDVPDVRAKNSGHGKKTADKWNQ